MKRRTFGATTASLAATQLAGPAYAAAGSTAGQCAVVARFWGSTSTGVTVSRHGRSFVNFPRWDDDVPFTVAERRQGKPVAYPNAEVNREDASDLAGHFQSVQSVVVDPADRLWILDTGNPLFAGSSCGGPKGVLDCGEGGEELAEAGGFEDPQVPGMDTDQCQVAASVQGPAPRPAEQTEGRAVEEFHRPQVHGHPCALPGRGGVAMRADFGEVLRPIAPWSSTTVMPW